MPAEKKMSSQPQVGLKVLHFVTGGFSGATQVAIDLCQAAQRTPGMEVMLVLRRNAWLASWLAKRPYGDEREERRDVLMKLPLVPIGGGHHMGAAADHPRMAPGRRVCARIQ